MGTVPFDYGSFFTGQAPPPYGMNPYDPYSTYATDYSQGNPAYAMKQNRAAAGAWMGEESKQLTDQSAEGQQWEDAYRAAGNRVGSDILNAPGYTQDEYGNITNPAGYRAGMTTPEQFASLAPTSSESSGMLGDTGSYGKYFDPVTAALPQNVQAADAKTSAAIQGATSSMGAGLSAEGSTFNDLFSNPNLSPSAGYYDAMGSALSETKAGVGSAVSRTAAGVKAALDPGRLALNLNPRYQMSDQEVTQMENQAAEAAHLSEASRMSEIGHRMAAAGNTDPLAFAALSQESQGQADESAANAVTQAQIQAEDAQRQTWMNYAQGNLSANQTRAAMEEQGAFGVGQMGMQGALSTGQMGEDVAQKAQDTGLSAAQWQTGQHIGAEEALTGQGLGAAQWTGNQGVQSGEDLANLYQNALEYTGSTGTGIAESQDQANAARQAQLYGIRQGNTMYGQQQGFQQNFMTQEQLSNLYAQAAQARMAQQGLGLQWATGQQGQEQQNRLNLNQQQIGVAGTGFGAENTATGQWGQYDLANRQNSFGGSFMKGFGGALGESLGSFGMSGKSSGGGAWGIGG